VADTAQATAVAAFLLSRPNKDLTLP
jgi:hypothetical protein